MDAFPKQLLGGKQNKQGATPACQPAGQSLDRNIPTVMRWLGSSLESRKKTCWGKTMLVAASMSMLAACDELDMMNQRAATGRGHALLLVINKGMLFTLPLPTTTYG